MSPTEEATENQDSIATTQDTATDNDTSRQKDESSGEEDTSQEDDSSQEEDASSDTAVAETPSEGSDTQPTSSRSSSTVIAVAENELPRGMLQKSIDEMIEDARKKKTTIGPLENDPFYEEGEEGKGVGKGAWKIPPEHESEGEKEEVESEEDGVETEEDGQEREDGDDDDTDVEEGDEAQDDEKGVKRRKLDEEEALE